MTDITVPLNRLIFGQADGAGINARVTGREDGIAELAANLHGQGQIENLIVKDAGNGFYSVANGNRRLAAFHMIHTPESDYPIRCTLHDVDETTAFEYSLTTAITAAQLHPVDQYEAFARLEEHGKTLEEIARQYGMSEKEVRQALALGRLSPKIREAWRKGEIKAEIARAFTLAIDHKTQEKAFEKLAKAGRLFESSVKSELGADIIDGALPPLIDFVGADAYRARGGTVVEDLFGTSHIVSDAPLLKQMAVDLLQAKCEELKADGWAWAELEANLPHGARHWPVPLLKPSELVFEGDEHARLESARKAFMEVDERDQDEEEKLECVIDEIETAVRSRSFSPKKKAKLGCIVDVEDGRLVVLYGVVKPSEVKASAAGAGDDGDDSGTAPQTAKKPAAAAPEEPEISQALLHRLSIQLTKAAATALIQNEQLALSVLLAGLESYDGSGVKVSCNGLGSRGERGLLGSGREEIGKALALASRLKPAERVTLLALVAANALDFQNAALDAADKHDGPAAICNAIDAKAMNAALRGAFEAKDYFGGVNKALCLKAIEEAMGADLARQQSKNPKGDIAAFATENVPATGWLPPQLRVKGYDGPPKAKVLAMPAKGKAAPKANARPAKKAAVKRAAAAKKAAKKISAKKRKG